MRTGFNLLMFVAWLASQDFRRNLLQGLTITNPTLELLSSLGNGTVRLRLITTKDVSEKSTNLVLDTILNVSDLYKIFNVIEKSNWSRLNFSLNIDQQRPRVGRNYQSHSKKVTYENDDWRVNLEDDDGQRIAESNDEEMMNNEEIVSMVNDVQVKPIILLKRLVERNQRIPKKFLKKVLEQLRNNSEEFKRREFEKYAFRSFMKKKLNEKVIGYYFPKLSNALKLSVDKDMLQRMYKVTQILRDLLDENDPEIEDNITEIEDREPEVFRLFIENVSDHDVSYLKPFQGHLDNITVNLDETKSSINVNDREKVLEENREDEPENRIAPRFGSNGFWNVQVDMEDRKGNLFEESDRNDGIPKLRIRNSIKAKERHKEKRRKPIKRHSKVQNSRDSLKNSKIIDNPEVSIEKRATEDILKNTKRRRKTPKTSRLKSIKKVTTASAFEHFRVVDNHAIKNVTDNMYPHLSVNIPVDLKRTYEGASLNMSTEMKIKEDSSKIMIPTSEDLAKTNRRMTNVSMSFWRSLSNGAQTFNNNVKNVLSRNATANLTLLKKIFINHDPGNWRTKDSLKSDSSSRVSVKLVSKKFAMDDILEAIDSIIPPERKPICSKIVIQDIALSGNVTSS